MRRFVPFSLLVLAVCVFVTPSRDRQDAVARRAAFLADARTHDMDGLKGHRDVGGLRASIYNAFPRRGCEVLASFMKDFVAKKG